MAYNTQVISDVIDFTVEEYDATGARGQVLFHVDYASETSIASNAERLDITGGIGGYKLASIDHSATAEFNATLPLVDLAALGVKLGKAMSTGATDSVRTKIYEINSDAITLDDNVSWITDASEAIRMYLVNGDRDIGTELTHAAATPGATEYTLTSGTAAVAFEAATYADGTKVMVTYEYTSGANAKELKITANNFPSYIRVTGRGFTMDEVSGDYVPVVFDVKKAKVKPSFELTMANGSATNVDFMLDCYTVLDGTDRVFISVVSLEDEV